MSKNENLSTGCTLLNLALTGNPFGGLVRGKYYFMVGDSASGKTFLSMTNLAEACINPNFKNYRLIYDNIEDGMALNLDSLFSEEVADRIEPPEIAAGAPVYSHTIESFYYHLDDAVKAGRPFIYILDSMDALDSESAAKKFEAAHKEYSKRQKRERGEAAERNGKKEEGEEEKVAGSYGTEKAKKNSEGLRKVQKGLRDTKSILIILSQTRDNIGYGGGKTRAGGRALRFYAHAEFWSSIVMVHKKTVNDIPRKIGIRAKLEMKKNRSTGLLRDVEVDIYPSVGFDDIGSCVDYLVEEGWWLQAKQTITTKGLGIVGTREKVIRVIEKRGLEDKVREQCGECWAEVEAACRVPRKNKYAVAETE